jgi:predicted transposase YbfD/YdcC
MEDAAAASGALGEAVVFLNHFKEMPDRRQRGKVVYPLDEVLLLCLLAVLAGADGFTDIARFGVKKLDLLRRFRPFVGGTPPHDTLGDIFASLDPHAFQRCFVGWVAALTKTPAEVIAIDGKTLRRSYQKKGAKEPIHMVSAFAARQRLALAQVKVSEKSNEIIAIPALLDMMEIEGAVVTIDAMGCQRAIAKKITDKKADYIIALKGNQGTLREDVEVFVTDQKANGFKDCKVSQHQTIDGDHGRIETRKYTVIHDVAWLQERHNWPGLNGVIIVDSQREIDGKIQCETRFYITSLVLLASMLGPMIRDHWMVENGLHWVMDMMFRDDECRIRTENAPANFTTLRHMAQNLYRKSPAKDSMRLKRKTAGWDDEYLASLIAG